MVSADQVLFIEQVLRVYFELALCFLEPTLTQTLRKYRVEWGATNERACEQKSVELLGGYAVKQSGLRAPESVGCDPFRVR